MIYSNDTMNFRLRALTLSWLRAAREANDQLLSNMLNCGQLINNRTSDLESNVSYIEIDLPRPSLKRSHLRYIPNITYTHTEQDQSIRLCGKWVVNQTLVDTFQILHKSYSQKAFNLKATFATIFRYNRSTMVDLFW